MERTRRVPRGTAIIDSQHRDLEPPPANGAPRLTIERGLDALGLQRDPATLDRLAGLALLLSRWAPRMNLTGHRGADSIASRLILDAAALIGALPPFELLADLGSGAGFPGLPIAILFPERRLISVEARSRRVSFQKTAIRELGIENALVVLGRIEILEPRPADAVVAQAVAPPDRVLDLMLPWCVGGGWLAIPGSPDSLASPPASRSVGSDAQVLHYRVPSHAGQPGHAGERRVWLARKRGPAGAAGSPDARAKPKKLGD